MKSPNRKQLHSYLYEKLMNLNSIHEISWILDFIENKKLNSLDDELRLCDEIIDRKQKEEPLAYIFGFWSFRNYEVYVGPGALIPRPETEELVEAVIMSVENSETHARKLLENDFHIVDLGAGTGCIGLSLVSDLLKDIEAESSNAFEVSKKISLTFVESSPQAIKWLEKNIHAFKTLLMETKVNVIEKNWNDLHLTDVDVVVSNPPYISLEEFQNLDVSVKEYEPKAALLAENPFLPYQEIFNFARKALLPGGWVFAEIGPAQGEKLQEVLSEDVDFNEFRTLKDISKKPRFVSAKRGVNRG